MDVVVDVCVGLVHHLHTLRERRDSHAKGASFRTVPEHESQRKGEEDKRAAVTIVGSSNLSQSGQRNNVELTLLKP